jgi:DNA-binding PadR family transcriptional regulator
MSMAKSPARDVIPSGTLDVLILTTLNRSGELHGFEIAEAIEARSEDVLTWKKARCTRPFSGSW